MEAPENLASYRRCVERISGSWGEFQARRHEHLREKERFQHAAERATEGILEDLFTGVLDWSVGDVNHQVGYADILLSSLGVKHLIVEAKRPGALAWNRAAIDAALAQAHRYASEQGVNNIAVSDGHVIYAAEVAHGGRRGRCFARLDTEEPPGGELFWLSVHGIYRPVHERSVSVEALLPDEPESAEAVIAEPRELLLHPKYQLPAQCFAYVGDAAEPKSWHLPYRLQSGEIDARRLPKAIQAILTNYRGARVSSVPEEAVPDVLVRLACAAASAGKMPDQSSDASPVYCALADVLIQLGRADEVRPLPGPTGPETPAAP